jgi:RND superfamily putative drug exporter
MSGFFAGLSRTVVRFRWAVIALWVLAALVSVRTLPSLSSEVNNDNSQFLPANAPSSQADRLAAPILGNPSQVSSIILVAARPSGVIGLADEAALARLARLDAALPAVRAIRPGGVAPSGHAVELRVEVAVSESDIAAQKRVVDELVANTARAHLPHGLEVHLAGPVATNVANQASSARTGAKTQALTFLLIIVLLLAIFRSPLAPIVTLLPAGFALVISMRFIGGLGADGLKISEITQLLLIVLLLGAGTDYGLFLVFRVREEVRRGLAPRDAVVHALERVGESISASAGTVIFALLTLLLASFGIYHDLGIPLALGVSVILLAGLTLLPALLAVSGKALFWPARVGPSATEDEHHGRWSKLASRLVARPGRTLATGVAVFVALALGALGYHASGFGGALSAPARSDAAAGNALVARYFPHAAFNPANLILSYPKPIWADPSQVTRAEASLVASGMFRHLEGPFNPNGTTLAPATYARLHRLLGNPLALGPLPPASAGSLSALDYNAYRSSAQFVAANGRTIQFEAVLKAGPQSSTAAMASTPKVRAVLVRAARASRALASGVAGEAAALYDVSSTSNNDLLRIVPIAIAAIAILLALVLRSLVAELYLIVSVGLSYLAALGVSTIVFIDLGGAGGLTFILPFLMFIFLLALGEDYNILVMTRIREEAHHRRLQEAVVRAVARTGPTVSAAGVILAGTFAVLVVSAGSGPGASQIRDIGVGLAVGILMDTFLVRTLLVPSTVALLGRWNWWPSRLHVQDLPDPAATPMSYEPAGEIS